MSTEHPREVYEGVGFTGRCVGEVTLPRPAGSSPAAESDSDALDEQEPAASEGNPPVLYCLSCNSQATLLPGRRVWCPRCKTFSEVRGGGSIFTIATVIGVALLLMLVLFYVQGTFDHLAYSIGLNGVSESIKDGVRPLFR